MKGNRWQAWHGAPDDPNQELDIGLRASCRRPVNVRREVYVEPNRCDVRMSLVNTAFSPDPARWPGRSWVDDENITVWSGSLRVPLLAVECPNNCVWNNDDHVLFPLSYSQQVGVKKTYLWRCISHFDAWHLVFVIGISYSWSDISYFWWTISHIAFRNWKISHFSSKDISRRYISIIYQHYRTASLHMTLRIIFTHNV